MLSGRLKGGTSVTLKAGWYMETASDPSDYHSAVRQTIYEHPCEWGDGVCIWGGDLSQRDGEITK